MDPAIGLRGTEMAYPTPVMGLFQTWGRTLRRPRMAAAALAAVVVSGVLYAYVSSGRPEDGPVTDAWLAPLPDDGKLHPMS